MFFSPCTLLLSLLRRPSFFCSLSGRFFVLQVNWEFKKYRRNWRSKERKKEATVLSFQFLPCFYLLTCDKKAGPIRRGYNFCCMLFLLSCACLQWKRACCVHVQSRTKSGMVQPGAITLGSDQRRLDMITCNTILLRWLTFLDSISMQSSSLFC